MTNSTSFLDKLFLALLVFVLMVVAMVHHLNDPARDDDVLPPGNLIVHATWPEGDTDVDLWVFGPTEPFPVGYSNKSGLLWSLLRDDLGHDADSTSLNYENAYTRGVVAGRYWVNVHCYRCPVLPQEVQVEVSLKDETDSKSPIRVIARTTLELRVAGEELTAISFRIDNEGGLLAGSLNHLFKPLRNAKKGSPGAQGQPSYPGEY